MANLDELLQAIEKHLDANPEDQSRIQEAVACHGLDIEPLPDHAEVFQDTGDWYRQVKSLGEQGYTVLSADHTPSRMIGFSAHKEKEERLLLVPLRVFKGQADQAWQSENFKTPRARHDLAGKLSSGAAPDYVAA